MKKTSRLAFRISSLCASSFLLGCCSGEASSANSLKTNAFVVTYYDDAAVPQKLGTSIVLPHGKAPLPLSFESGVNYDYLSHSGLDPMINGSFVGNYWDFSSFSGTYADGTAIDLNDILSSIDVYAKFTARSYTYKTGYTNKGIAIRDNAGAIFKETLAYGTVPTFPSGIEDPSPFWYENSAFLGFSFKGDASFQVLSEGSAITFASGEGAPSGTGSLGQLYFDTAVRKDTFNRDFPAYYSNGASWIDLESTLKAGLSLTFEAAYSQSYKKFPVSFYSDVSHDSAGHVISGGVSLGEPLSVAYMDMIAFTISGTSTTFSYGAQSVTLTTSSTPKNWEGYYTQGKNYIDGKVDVDEIQGACFFYPVY